MKRLRKTFTYLLTYLKLGLVGLALGLGLGLDLGLGHGLGLCLLGLDLVGLDQGKEYFRMKGKVGNFENLFENSNNCWKNR